MADAIIEELWRVKDRMAREAGYDVQALAAAIRSAPELKHTRRGEAAGMREAQEPVAAGDAGTDSGSPDDAPAA